LAVIRWLRSSIAPGALLLVVVDGSAWAGENFEKVAVYLEQNFKDKDTEVKFEAIAGNIGLATLKVTAPDGRTVIDFKAPDSKLGIRHLILESPEPKNLATVKADFPTGAYRFTGLTESGSKLEAEALLSHDLPDETSFVYPRPDQKYVPLAALNIKWRPVKNSALSVITLEQERTGREIRANLSGIATEFAVPNGFLQPGTDYTLAIGTVSKEGNKSFTEITFRTAAKK
jgi:hypothetical protein